MAGALLSFIVSDILPPCRLVFEVPPALLIQPTTVTGAKAICEYLIESSHGTSVELNTSILVDECLEWLESVIPDILGRASTTVAATTQTKSEATPSAAGADAYIRSFLLADEFLPALRRQLSPENQSVSLSSDSKGDLARAAAPGFHLPAQQSTMAVLEGVLGKYPFIAGANLSLADLRLVTILHGSEVLAGGPEFLTTYVDRVLAALGSSGKPLLLAECADKIPVPPRDFSLAPETKLNAPCMGDKFYLTTAINYTNGSPHCGHAYEAVTSDIISR
jgi:glutathione S-transferase